ncbi:fatty-acyl-CoA synthase [Tistlia consotensis]|uniref:Fatty-acyl-CoA synthase n=1 Tax=Tistlia consotensis USBA 355 TaxID=560819 RepID=A0A1Y6CQN2_9PROT|nr:AMP-binding protein [Tistlia consotensis]SMF66087.1 fatty-acyl-CoA synthase [Tistlia consotensis USBA 355]SNS02739.1 fatty-acyl-CoA synthase [Tistlia consotensis]
MRYGLRDWAQRDPERRALEFEDGTSVTFGELEARANRLEQLFRNRGLARGDHVAGILSNGPDVIAAAWAAARTGLYYTPVAHTFSLPEIAHVVNDSTAALVLADGRFADRLAELPARCKAARHWLTTRTRGTAPHEMEDLEAALATMPDAPPEDESPGMLMMYSSGTTGAPRGIWRPLPSAEQIGEGPPAFARDLIEIFGVDPETRYLSPAPLYHAAPLRWTLAVIAGGGMALIMDKFDAERALDHLQRREITMSQWVPTMFRRMLALPEQRRAAFRAPRHHLALHAAAPCPVDLKRRMIDWWGPILTEYYAGSESVGLTVLDSAEWLAHPGSVGRAVKGRIRILGEDWSELPPRQVGKVYFSDSSKFEYFNDPEKTRSRLSPQGWQTFGEIGWVDEDGWLYLSDRQDDTIISGGVNIYPQELEQAIEEMAQVAECAVVAMPDEDFGERPAAFVVPVPGLRTSDEELAAQVAAHCKERLGRTKQPHRIRVVGELPRSEVGKLLRRRLREQLAAESLEAAQA